MHFDVCGTGALFAKKTREECPSFVHDVSESHIPTSFHVCLFPTAQTRLEKSVVDDVAPGVVIQRGIDLRAEGEEHK